VALGIDRDLYITIPRGTYQHLDATIELVPAITAPVDAGEVKGSLKVSLDGGEVVNQPLVVLQAVNTGNFISRLWDDIGLLFD
jgi:D-alanyl-D-alanine carboxypeptidase (penicillin-binding protein 5/6)